jgi:transcriptional regulator with XRE-family HTH domain
MKTTKTPSSGAHVTLKRLYDERVPEDMTQEQFGKQFGIGTQGMVSQYLNGTRPLNVEAAAKFARGLRCTIFDISPEMAETLKEDVVPVLGPKHWWGRHLAGKLAGVMLMISPALAPQPAEAADTILSNGSRAVYYVKLICAWIRRFIPKRQVAVS